MSAIHDQLDDRIQALWEQAHKVDPYYYPGCGMPVSKELATVLREIDDLEYQRKYTCKCGKPADDMYDDYGIYAGRFCSEECCGLNLHWVNDGSECLDEDY